MILDDQDLQRYSIDSPYYMNTRDQIVSASVHASFLYAQHLPTIIQQAFSDYYQARFQTLVPLHFQPQDPFANQRTQIYRVQNGAQVMQPYPTIASIIDIPHWPFPNQFEAFPQLPSPDGLLVSRWNQTLNSANSSMYRNSFFSAPLFNDCCIIPFHNENHIVLLYVYGQFNSTKPVITKVCYADPAGVAHISSRLAKLICMTLEYAAACRNLKPDFSQIFKRNDQNGYVKYDSLDLDVGVLASESTALDSLCYTICQIAYILFYRLSHAPHGYFKQHVLSFQAMDDFFQTICQQHANGGTNIKTNHNFRFSIPCYIEMLTLPNREGHRIYWNPVGINQLILIDPINQPRRREIKEEQKEESKNEVQFISTNTLPARLQSSAQNRQQQYDRMSVVQQATIIYHSIVRYEDHLLNQRPSYTITRALSNIRDALHPYVTEMFVQRLDYDDAFQILFKDLTELYIKTGFRKFAFPYQHPSNTPLRDIEAIVFPYLHSFTLDELQAGYLHQIDRQQPRILANERIQEQQAQPETQTDVEFFINTNIDRQHIATTNARIPVQNLVVQENVEAAAEDIHFDTFAAMQIQDRTQFENEPFEFFGDNLVIRPINILTKMLIQRYNSSQDIRAQYGNVGYYSIRLITFRHTHTGTRVFPFHLILEASTVKRSSVSELKLIIAEYISKYIRSIFEEYDDVDSLDRFRIQFAVNAWRWSAIKPSISQNLNTMNIQRRFLAAPAAAYSWFNNFSNLVHRFYTTYYLKWGPKFINSEWAIDLEYLEDSQYYIVQFAREHRGLKTHPLFQGQPCLQILCNIVLSFSIVQHYNLFNEQLMQIDQLKERGETYVHWLQESRLSLMDTHSLRGNAKAFMKGIIDSTKHSLQKLNENPSIVDFIGVEGFGAAKFIFDRLSIGERGQRLMRSEKYQILAAHCVNGKTIQTVHTLNQIISELRTPFRVYYLSIHSLVKSISTVNVVQPGVEKIFNPNTTIRLINVQIQLDNHLLPPPSSSDFVFLTTTDHALLFKVSQLVILAQHIFTQSFCAKNSQKRAFQQHCLLFKDTDNIDGMFFKRAVDKVNPTDNIIIPLQSDEQLANKHIAERRAANIKFLSRYSNIDFRTQFTGDIKIQHFSELTIEVKSQLLVYLTNKKLQYKFDEKITDLYVQDGYYFSFIYQAVQIPIQLDLKQGFSMTEFVTRQRKMKFCATGLLAFDCETFTYNENRCGNQHVFIVSLYGRARCLNKPPNAPLETIDKIFTGINAMDDFVDYLVFKGIILTITDEQQCQNFITFQLAHGKIAPNTIFAHNGNKFDFKLLIQSLQRVCKVNTIGSLSQLKKLTTIGCSFMDSILVLSGSLAKLCKTYEPKIKSHFTLENSPSQLERFVLEQYNSHPSVQKSSFDVKGYTFQEFTANMKERAHGGSIKLDQFEAYCRLDSISLYFIVHVFFEMNYTLPFYRLSQGNIETQTFLPTMFPLSVASLSTEVYKLAFSNHILRPNLEALDIERNVFCGGFTSLFQTRIKLGAAMDVNSSYATAMQNPLPAFHRMKFSDGRKMKDFVDQHAALPPQLQEEYLNYKAIKIIDQEIDTNLTQGADFAYKSKRRIIEPHCLYQIMFEVKRGDQYGEQDCILSALIIRSLTGDSIVEPSKVSDEDRQPDDRTKPLGGVWVWGVKILYMLKMGYLNTLTIKRAIFYIAHPLYHNFIKTQFQKRLEAKQAGNEILSLYYKNIMNTLYGKTGQKPTGITETGDACSVAEEIMYLSTSHDKRQAQTMQFKAYLQKDYLFKQTENVIDIFNNEHNTSYNTDLHQLVIKPSKDDEINQIGSLVRIAAYISSIGQLELVQAFNQINLELNIRRPQTGKLKFCYTDTDSIYCDFWDPLLDEFRGTDKYQTLINLDQAWLTTSQQFTENGQLSILHQNICQLVKNIFIESQLYKTLLKIQIFNPTIFGEFQNNFTMVDQSNLGAFKIERICFGGVFTAPKQYTLLQIDMEDPSGQVTTLFKGKGVNKDTLKQQPTALFKQETGFLTVVEKLNPLMESEFMVQKLDNYRQQYVQGQQNLDQVLALAKADYTQICRQAMEDSNISQIIKDASESLVCIFINESAFQASGSFITIRSMVKTVLPSMSKRKAITNGQDGVISEPPSDLFAFEIQRVKQSASLSLIRSYVINNIDAVRSVIQSHKPQTDVQLTNNTAQSVLDARTASNTLRTAIRLSQLANKITNRLYIINDIVRNINPTTIFEINNKLISCVEQSMSLQDVMELFNYLNSFSECRTKFKQVNGTGQDDLFVILKYVYFESQRYWFWPLTYTNFTRQLQTMEFELNQQQSLLDDFILCSCIANFTRIFKIYCEPINHFLNIFYDLYKPNIGKVRPTFDNTTFSLLISTITLIQNYSYAKRDPMNGQITRLTVREHMTLSTSQFINRVQPQPSTLAKQLISKFREISQCTEERRIQQITIQMLNQVRIGVVAILRDSIQENFSFESIKPLSEELKPLIELDGSQELEDLVPVNPEIVYSTTSELSKVKRHPQTLVGNDQVAALNHLHTLRSRLQAKFDEAQDDALMIQLERSHLLEEIQDANQVIDTNQEVQIIT